MTPPRSVVRVFRHRRRYVARFSAPDVRETFVQDTLPTAYSADARPLDVLVSVARDNPDATVLLVPCSTGTPPHASDAAATRRESPTA